MNNQDLFELYQKLYWYDIEAREHLNTRLQIPLGIIVALAGLLGFMLQNYEHKATTWTTGSFIALALLAALALIVSTLFFVQSGYRHAYSFLPDAATIEAYRISLESHYTTYPDPNISASNAFDGYLLKHYIDYSSINTAVNDTRSRKLHQTNTAIICTATLLGAAFLVFYFGRLDKANEDKTTKVLITSPVVIKGDVMSGSQPASPPPPPPPPPPARVVREDGGRHHVPPLPQPRKP
jgi:hypothetical protein